MSHTALRARHDYRTARLPRFGPDGLDGDDAHTMAAELRTELIAAEREYIYRMLQEGKITDEARRHIERELDLEEASIACEKEGGDRDAALDYLSFVIAGLPGICGGDACYRHCRTFGCCDAKPHGPPGQARR